MLTDARPWMTALEMQFAAIRALDAQGVGYGRIDGRTSFQQILRQAETYAWSSDTSRAVAFASKTIPNTSRVDRALLPGTGTGWWSFDPPVLLNGVQVRGFTFGFGVDGQLYFQSFVETDFAIRAATRQAGKDRAKLARVIEHQMLLGAKGLTMFPVGSWSFDVDSTTRTVGDFTTSIYSEVDEDETRGNTADLAVAILKFFIAGCSWLTQRILVYSKGPVERHRRKQLAREFGATISDVKVIVLRRAELTSHIDSTNGESVEWSCRWIVNGHWRNQYHPSTGRHELKYILPYMKGPEDKPLRIPKATVYAVTR